MRYSRTFIVILSVIGITSACKQAGEQPVSSLDITGIDTSKSPGEDFFDYVNGHWLDTVNIPSTQVGVGSFFDLQIRSKLALKKVCEEAVTAKNHEEGTLYQMVGDMYTSIMDTVRIEQKGFEPLQPSLRAIDDLADTNEMIRFVADEFIKGNTTFFGFGVAPDDKNASMNIAAFSQAGLGLPDRDYYFREDAASGKIRIAYVDYLTIAFALVTTNTPAAPGYARAVYDVEKKLASGHFTNVALRDPEKNYNKKSIASLSALTPRIDWKMLCSTLQIQGDSVVISQLPYFTRLNDLLGEIPLEDWKVYLKATTITNSAQSLTRALADANFDFYGRTLAGQKDRDPRWKYAVNMVDARIGDLAGQLYVKENFNERAREKMMEMIDNLQLSYEKRIQSLDWMSDTTKKMAFAKLHTIIRKIGFPDKWKTYDSLVIRPDDYFGNRINTSRYAYFRNVSKNGKPVDKSEWNFTPPTVNAFYNTTTNQIMFLAGILQPPFFYAEGDDAINYGAIGMVIGHELTHGFDDQGRQYDKDGNLKDWWLKEDADQFSKRAARVGVQYASYSPIDTLHINPDLTMGENLADIGGLAIAYDAFKMTSQGRSGKKLDGLTPDQRFFISFANIWKIRMKDELMRQLVVTDVHSPAKFRVNGPLTNFTPFYEAFDVKEQDAMWKPVDQRISIW